MERSLTGENPFESKLTARFELADLVTFAQNKMTSVYDWFYYKEGFSRDFVWDALKRLNVGEGSLVLDPFCGTGTTLLAAKQAGYYSVGFDILPLGVFVSRVKLKDYDLGRLAKGIARITPLKFGNPRMKLPDIRFLDMRRVYNQYARQDIAFFMEKILEEEDEKTRNFMLLALISIVGQASNVMKDGGVLKVVRKKHVPPVRHLLDSKMKRMLRDLKELPPQPRVKWKVNVGDARDIRLEDGSVDAVITSPPYLNNVDYTKVYALELSLLVQSAREMEELRRKSLRSHIGAEKRGGKSFDGMEDIMARVTKTDETVNVPPVVEGYIQDMYENLSEVARVLKPKGVAAYVVGNSALPGITVDVDLMLAEMGEKLGLTTEDIWVANARWAGVHDIEKERPVRESAVILRKG